MTTSSTGGRTGAGEPHVVLVGTKPDIIKQVPIYHELVRRGHHTVMCHTGQHYDHNLSGALLDEFGVDNFVNLEAGDLPGALVGNILERFRPFLQELEQQHGPPITYVHGDTTTCMAGALTAQTLDQGIVHVEAGLRTLSPTKAVLQQWVQQARAGELDWATFSAQSADQANYTRGSREPLPEQFNTKVADAAAHLHAAPVELNRQYLLDEGFAPRSIDVVSNSVVDAVQTVWRADARDSLLATHPDLASGEYIRYCVHRRENTLDRARFTALMQGLEGLLERGHKVLFIRLYGTDAALQTWGMQGWFTDLQARFGASLISTPVWESYSEVMEAMKMCKVVATDSGSIQEEVNVLGVPCVTLRYGSDRGETFLAGTNFLAPPVDGQVIAATIDLVAQHAQDIPPRQIYAGEAAAALVDAVESRLAESGRLQLSEEWRYGLA